MGRAFLDAAKKLRPPETCGPFPLHSDAPVEHLLCHSTELLMKAALLGIGADVSIFHYGHRLRCLFERSQEEEGLRQALRDAEESMNARIGSIRRASLSLDEAVERWKGTGGDGSVDGIDLPSYGSDAVVKATDLFEWYGVQRAKSGGYSRYPRVRYEHVQVMETTAGQLELFPLALHYWTEAFAASTFRICFAPHG